MRAGLLLLMVAALVAAAILLRLDSRSDVRLMVIRDGDVELVPLDGAAGPESVVFGERGEGPFTGVSDGRVLRWRPAERRWEEHSCSAPELLESCRGSRDPGRELECGRPLGLKFNNETAELYVADAYHGLRVVGPNEKVSRPLMPEWQGSRPFSFANGVEIDHETGAIYFTETSTRFQRREFLSIVISGDKTGRLLKYDPKNNHVEVLVDGLSFPNGLAMSSDGTYLLLAETTTGKILKYWIKTAKASTMEEVVQLSWFPDNIKWSPRGGFWVGLHAKRGKIAEWSISYPWLRRLILKLPMRHVQRVSTLLSRLGRQVIALRLTEEGKSIEAVSVHGDVQKVFKSVSEVEERNGSLFIGSVRLTPTGGLLGSLLLKWGHQTRISLSNGQPKRQAHFRRCPPHDRDMGVSRVATRSRPLPTPSRETASGRPPPPSWRRPPSTPIPATTSTAIPAATCTCRVPPPRPTPMAATA